jgi:chromosome segregation ATPase
MAFRFLISLALLAVAASKEVTPIDKVISLLDDMKTELETESKAEAATYDEFACFCKKTTETKSTSVQDNHDKIEDNSADLADKTATKNQKSTELAKRKVDHEQLSAKLEKEVTRHAAAKAEYEANEADLSKAISSLKNAIKAMKESKPAASFLQGAVKDDLMQTLAIADAMSLITPKRKAVTSMIQSAASVDPADPEYKYHSNDIISLCEDLLKDFQGQKLELNTEWGKAVKAHTELKKSLEEEISANDTAMKGLVIEIDTLVSEIAEHRTNIVEADASLKDDELYLKDLTAQCEARAHDYDQRSSMRADELNALTQALEILTGEVKDRADEVNVRALLMQKMLKAGEKAIATRTVITPPSKAATVHAAKAVKKPISFLQGMQAKGSAKSFLAVGLSDADRKDRALALLTVEGQRLGSFVLTSLAQRSAADPFKKVKGLIQQLIERLLREATAEATKKGFCDTELGKAYKDRDARREDTNDLSAALQGLEAKRDGLVVEIDDLEHSIKAENLALTETTAERKDEKEQNMATLKTAKEGFAAVGEALVILKNFYKQAAKAAFIQASPVDEDTQGPGFSGSYKGNQSGSKAVLALLETIASDFDRTIRTTEAAEEHAHRDYVDFVQHAKSSLAAKETKKELDEADLKTTNTEITTKMEDLTTAMNLLDAALKEIENLKPTCIDTGMSYQERVEKREEEITALKKAVCILDSEGVEPECGGGLQ